MTFRVTDTLKWSGPPEMEDVEEMAEMAAATGPFALSDLPCSSVAQREHLYALLSICSDLDLQ